MRRFNLEATLLAFTLSLVPSIAFAEDATQPCDDEAVDGPVRAEPPAAKQRRATRRNLWIPGATLLIAGYVASSHISAGAIAVDSGWCDGSVCRNDVWGWGFVPAVGPVVIAFDPDYEPGWRVAYGLFGIAQNLGLALTIAGATSTPGDWPPDESALAMPEVKLGAGDISAAWRF